MLPTTFLPPSPDVEIESDETVWNGRFPLQRVKFRNRRFDGHMSGPRTWELWRRGRASAVLPYDPVTDHVVVIEQFRLPALAAGLDPVMVELCAGLADDDEVPEVVARREAVEEMHLEIFEIERIGAFLLTPGGSDECCTIFAGRVKLDNIPQGGLLGYGGLAIEQEDIAVRAIRANLAIENALAGAYPNSVTSLGLLWLAAKRDWLRARWAS